MYIKYKYMDQKILNQLEEIRTALINVVTKDDLRSELSKYATKADLKNFATKDDLKNLVTKAYLDEQLKKQSQYICEDLGEVINNLITETDKVKANKSDVQILE